MEDKKVIKTYPSIYLTVEEKLAQIAQLRAELENTDSES